MYKAKDYYYCVVWSREDDEFVATCNAFPYLSCLASDKDEALNGLKSIVASELDRRNKAGEEIPEPIQQGTL